MRSFRKDQTGPLPDRSVTPSNVTAVTSPIMKPDSGLVTPTPGGSVVLTGAPGAWTDVPGLSAAVTPTVPSLLLVDFSVLFELRGAGAGFNAGGEIRVLADASDDQPHGRAQITAGSANPDTVVVAAVSAGRIALAAGAHTIKIQARSEIQDGGSTINMRLAGFLKWLLHAS